MKKFYIIVPAILVVLALAGWLIWREPSSKSDVIHIGYDGTSVHVSPLMIAYEKHFFQKNGLTPSMLSIGSGKEVAQALVSGQVDIADTGFPNLLAPISKGAPIRIIAPGAMARKYVFIRPDSNIKKLSDLYGKTISAGLTTELSFRLALSEKNLDAKRINFVNLDKAYLSMALFQKKTIDAVAVSEQDTKLLTSQGAVVLPEWISSGYANRMLPSDAIYSSPDFLNKNPKIANAFIDTYIEASRYLHDHPEQSAKLVSAHIKKSSEGAIDYSPQYILDKWKKREITYFLWYDPEIIIKMANIAHKVGMIDKEFTDIGLFDFRYQLKLQKAQNEFNN